MQPTKTQKFRVECWQRESIKNAPYNPRTLDSYARKKLDKNLRKVGLLEPIVVNAKTGNIVSGHQRLACIDAIEGKSDYTIDVSVVELSPKQEREQNIFFNNPSAQGEWDLDKLGKLLKCPDVELEATGFDPTDIQTMFDDDELASAFAPPETAKPVFKSREEEIEARKRLLELRQQEKQFVTQADDADDTEFYSVIMFQTRLEQERFCKTVGADPNDQYINGFQVAHRLGIDI